MALTNNFGNSSASGTQVTGFRNIWKSPLLPNQVFTTREAAMRAEEPILAEQFSKTPAGKIYQQLKGQSNNLGTGKSFETGAAGYGENGFGSTDSVLRDMASTLANAGLTSIEQLSKGPITGFINKETGKELTTLTGFGGQGWGGTAAGDGQTIYDVNFDPATGLPIFYNRQTHGRDQYAGLLKAVAIGTAIFAPQIGAAILGPGASSAAALAAGSAVSGFIGSGGDIKAGIKAGLAAYLGGQAGSWASKATNSALVGNIAANMTRTAILGGDMSTALVSSLVQAAPAEIIKQFPSFAQLPRAAQEAAVAATVDLMRTGGDNLDTIALKGATDGLTDYTLKQIPGYNDLRKGQQDVVRERVGNVVRGESLSNELLQGAIQMGTEAVRYQTDTDRAVKAGWKSLEEQQAATSLFGSKVTPTQFADKQDTTEAEAKEIARGILGREPTEFEYMQLIGLPENEAAKNSDLAAIKYDESTFDSNELAEAYKAVYGREPTKEWLASDEAMDMLGRSDAQGSNLLQNAYIKDKNWVTEDEAKQFWKSAGNTGTAPQTFIDEMLMTSESGAKAMAETYRIRKEDLDATTFDGSKYKDQKEAQAAAIKNGYNNYIWGNQNYYLMSQDQAETLKKDIAAGKTAGPKPDAFFTSVPGMSLEQQLAAAGNPDSYAYMQGDTIVVVAKRMGVPSYKDLEAWDAFKAEKEALGGDNFQSFLTEKFSILEQAMKGAPPDSVLKALSSAAMFGYGKIAQLAQTFTQTGEAMGIPQAERGTNIAKQIQSWSTKLVDQGIQNAEAAVLANVAAVTKESIAAERGVKPSDISTPELYAQKAIAMFKQIPNNPLGVSLFLAGEGIQEIPLLAASGGVGNVLRTVASKSIQLSAAVGTNVALNGVESFGGNYGEVKDYLRKQGVPDSQIEALAIKSGFEAMAVGMLTSYAGDRALIKSFMGDLAKDSFGKVIATNSTKEWFLGNFEGTLQNMSAQIGKYGSIKSEDEWLNAGIMEGFAQKGIAAGVLTADALSRVVAKDYDGKPVTYRQIIDGEKTFDPKTVDKNFSFSSGVNLGDAIGYHSTFITNPDITPDEYFYTAQTFRDNGMNDFTPQEIASLVGTPGEMSPQQISKIAQPYAQERVVTPQEAQQMMRDLGYTNFTDAEAMSLAGQISEANAKARIQEYIAPRQVTREEAESFFDSIPGYEPTEADIAAFVRQGSNVNQDAVRSEVAGYVDPRMVTEQEAKDAYAALGLSKPTQADVLKLVGQYDQTGLTDKATANLDSARYNSILDQLDSLSVGASKETLDAIALVKNDLNAQITALGGDLTKQFATDLAQTEKDILAEVAKNEKAGMTRDAALQKAINTVAATQKKDVAALTKSISGLGTDLGKEIDAVQADLAQTEKDILAQVAVNEKAGMTRDAALQKAINTVAATQKTNTASLLSKLGTTEAALKTEFTKQFGEVQTQISDLEQSLSDEIQAAKDIGLAGDAALQAGLDSLSAKMGINQTALLSRLGKTEAALKAQFTKQVSSLDAKLTKAIADAKASGLAGDAALQKAVQSVADELGTTKESLLTQMGKTEESLRAEFATGISGLETQIQEQYNTLTEAQKATADALVAQGKTLAEAIESAKTETAGQIADVETRLTDAIAAAEAMGLTRDQAITAAVESVAAELGTTKADLLTQLGTTEAALRTEFTTGLAGVSAEVKAAYNSLSAEQKALADQLAQQGVDLTTAIQQAQQQTQGQIGALSADMQAKYDALSTEQKALANDMAQQGMDLNAAINLAQQQTQAQITGLGQQVDARINELMQQGQTYQQATQQAIGELNTQNQEMRGLIGTQGRQATQADIDVMSQMLGGQRAMDLTYDVTGDKQVTQADIDFLTQVVSGVKTDYTPPAGSFLAPTGLYGQLAANEAQRQADLRAQQEREQAAAAEADRQAQISGLRGTLAKGQQTFQQAAQQLPQAYRQAQEVSTPIYGQMGEYLDLGTPLDVGFFQPSPEKQAGTKQQQPTKIAAGGYIDDLLAEGMSVDDLLNLLR